MRYVLKEDEDVDFVDTKFDPEEKPEDVQDRIAIGSFCIVQGSLPE